MSAPTTSLVAVSAANATKAAAAILVYVKDRRAKGRAFALRNALKTERRWTRWLRRRPITQQEAEALVDGEHCWLSSDGWLRYNDHARWQTALSGNETFAGRLQSAAALSADGYVYLNLEDADIVQSFLT